MISYRQRDYNQTLGFGATAIAQEGCFITVMARIVGKAPPEVNDILKNNGGYANKNWVNWFPSAQSLGLTIYRLLETYDNTKVILYLKEKKRVCVIVNGAPIGGFEHMVEYLGGGQCFDPWTGTIVPTSNYPMPKKVVVFEPFRIETVKPRSEELISSKNVLDSGVEAGKYHLLLKTLVTIGWTKDPASEVNNISDILKLLETKQAEIERIKTDTISKHDHDKILQEANKTNSTTVRAFKRLPEWMQKAMTAWIESEDLDKKIHN